MYVALATVKSAENLFQKEARTSFSVVEKEGVKNALYGYVTTLSKREVKEQTVCLNQYMYCRILLDDPKPVKMWRTFASARV